MNIYSVNRSVQEKPNSMGFAVALIDNERVEQLRYIDDILGPEYHAIVHGVSYFSEAILDLLCFHPKTVNISCELSTLSEQGDVCFGILMDGKFTEL